MNHSPYKDEATNTIYNLLFCDDLTLYKAKHEGPVDGPWKTLFADPSDSRSVRALADSSFEETRLRILAFNALKTRGVAPQEKELLGVVIEVGFDRGLDTLAAYQDLRARYINQSGRLIIWETREPKVDSKIRNLFQVAQIVVEQIGPWKKPGLSPPTAGVMRMTFLVTDGLYCGRGPMDALQRDPLAAPVVKAATDLLVELTKQVPPK